MVPEHVAVATPQKAFFSLCEGPRCCIIGHGGPDAGIMSPSAMFQWDGLVELSPLEINTNNNKIAGLFNIRPKLRLSLELYYLDHRPLKLYVT